MCQKLLRDARFLAFQLAADRVSANEVREQGCVECAGVLHSANFTRKPRGGPAGLAPEADLRFSLCCAEDGCRSRHTPASLRFLGRKVYLGAVVVLVSAMRHGVTPARMRKLSELVGVSRRTVERWHTWWRTTFAESRCWRAAAGRFMPAVATDRLPASLLERFLGDDEARVTSILRLLAPITGGAAVGHAR
jgi:hypothetical protein